VLLGVGKRTILFVILKIPPPSFRVYPRLLFFSILVKFAPLMGVPIYIIRYTQNSVTPGVPLLI